MKQIQGKETSVKDCLIHISNAQFFINQLQLDVRIAFDDLSDDNNNLIH